MKKVLIIAYAFPPSPFVGSQRPYRLAKYFPEFGWTPIVLTIKRSGEIPQNIRMIESGNNLIIESLKAKLGFDARKTVHEQLGIVVSKNFQHTTWKSKSMKLIKELIAFPDVNRGWFDFAVKAASDFLSDEKVDAVISSSPPVTAHLIARKLKRKYHIPWIADFRDLWTQSHYYDKFRWVRYMEERLESRTISDANVVVTVHPLGAVLKRLHKDKEILWISNGYDTDDYRNGPERQPARLTLTYTGTLYNGKRDPSLLFDVVSRLINEKKIRRELIEMRFFGSGDAWLKEEIEKFKLTDVVRVCAFLPRDEIIKAQSEAHLLLLLLWNHESEKDILPGKVFEYLGARRPIIAIGGLGGVVKELLETTNAGKFAVDANSLKNIIMQYYKEFLETGGVKCDSNGYVENYTYKSIAEKYASILNMLV